MRATTRILSGSLIALCASAALAQRPYFLLPGVHPGYSLASMRPTSMTGSGSTAAPNVGGMAWLPDGRLFIASMSSNSAGGINANRLGTSNGYIFSGIPTAASNADVSVSQVSTGYQMPSGAVAVGDTLFVLDNQDGITKLTPAGGGAYTKTTLYKGVFGYTTANGDTATRTWTGGLAYKNGYLYAVVGMALIPGGTSFGFAGTQAARIFRGKGSVWKVSQDGTVADTVAGGVRNPVNLDWGPDGELFYIDNQGSFEPACAMFHVRQGRYFGHPKTPFDNQLRTPPAIVFPYGSASTGGSESNPTVARVASGMVTFRDGRFKDQMLIGATHTTGVNRVFLEKIPDGSGGYIYQGALFPFSQGMGVGVGANSSTAPAIPGVLSDFRSNVNRMSYGPDGRIYLGGGNSPGDASQGSHGFSGGLQYGLARLSANTDTVFEMKAIRSLNSTQMEIEFTEPVNSVATSNFTVRQMGSLQGGSSSNESYGSGWQSSNTVLTVSAATLSPDKRKATITLTGLAERPAVTTAGSVQDRTWGNVIQIKVTGVTAVSNRPMWQDTAAARNGLVGWYTLNKFGPGVDAGVPVSLARGDDRAHPTGLVFSRRAGALVVHAPDAGAWTLNLLDTRGRLLSTHAVAAGRETFSVPVSAMARGLTLLEAKTADGRRFTASATQP